MSTLKLKRVDRNELVKGLLVVVNNKPDAIIYTVDLVSPNGFVADLVYESNGQKMSGGAIDVSYLYHPKKRPIVMPSAEEDAAITTAALTDPDCPPLTSEQLAQFKPARKS